VLSENLEDVDSLDRFTCFLEDVDVGNGRSLEVTGELTIVILEVV
jgi:hypothetical protein